MTGTSDQPNVLLIMSDEHDPGVMGCYGDDIVDTGNLDGLARRGVTFENCYTNSPICVPARLSFVAGQYVSRCSAWSNDCWLPSDDYPTLPHAMGDAGYDCLLAGEHDFDATRRYGFTDLYDPPKEGHRTGRVNRRRVPPDDSVRSTWWQGRTSDCYVGEDARHFRWDTEVTDRAGTFLRERDPDDDPFFLQAGYIAPHYPLVAPFEYYQKYHAEVPVPEIPDGFFEELPTNYDQLRRTYGSIEVDHSGDKVRFARELYWALVDWFDDQVGQLLDALAESAVAENTVVIYTSDHGENKGDHGMWWKNCMYDQSASVPLIVSFPERWAGDQRRTGVCSLVDLAATIADLGGADAPDGWDGDSLCGLLEDSGADWKDFALSENYSGPTSGYTMYREGRYKYVYHARIDDEHGPETELYDMEEDPGEFENLADDDAHRDIRERLHECMLSELGEHPDDIEQRARREGAEGYDRKDSA